MSQGRLVAYAKWQLVDFMRERALAIMLVGLFLGGPVVAGWRRMRTTGMFEAAMTDQFVIQMLMNMSAQLVPVFTLIVINKIVAGDRSNGYYRFLFAKPISIERFYSQLFGLHALGLLGCVALLILLGNVVGAPLPFVPLLSIFIVGYIGMGGIGFLMSVITRFDWQVMVALWITSSILYAKFNEIAGAGAVLLRMLPPTHLMSDISGAILQGQSVEVFQLVWLLGYGLACFGLGVFLLRYRELAS